MFGQLYWWYVVDAASAIARKHSPTENSQSFALGISLLLLLSGLQILGSGVVLLIYLLRLGSVALHFDWL